MAPEGKLDAAYRRVWHAFREGEFTADGRHDTDYWRSHDGPYAVAVVRIPAAALEPQLQGVRRSLEQIGAVRLHPDHFLHITLQELGFVTASPLRADEISPERLEEFAQAAVGPASDTSPFVIELAGVNSFQDAAFLETHGSNDLSRLHEQLFDLAALPQAPAYAYLPHCTIAHYTRAAPTGSAVEAIAPWRDESLGRFVVSEIEIVTLDPKEPYPPLESYAVIPLGG